MQRVILQRLAVVAEMMEAKLANGEQIDVGEHVLLTSIMVRVARHLPGAAFCRTTPCEVGFCVIVAAASGVATGDSIFAGSQARRPAARRSTPLSIQMDRCGTT